MASMASPNPAKRSSRTTRSMASPLAHLVTPSPKSGFDVMDVTLEKASSLGMSVGKVATVACADASVHRGFVGAGGGVGVVVGVVDDDDVRGRLSLSLGFSGSEFGSLIRCIVTLATGVAPP